MNFLRVLVQCYYGKYFRHHFLTVKLFLFFNLKQKQTKLLTNEPFGFRAQKNYCTMLQHWSQLVPNMSADIWGHQASLIIMDGSDRLLLSMKKEVSGTFTCPVTALPVSYQRRLTLCTALSTTPRGHPGFPAAKHSFYFGLLNSVTPNLSLLWLHNLEKNWKELWKYIPHCFILSSLLL